MLFAKKKSNETYADAARLIPQIISIIGLGLVIFSIFSFSSQLKFPGFFVLIPCIGSLLLIKSNEAKNTYVFKVLSFQPLVFTGLISYGLYLWHWPLIVFSKYINNNQDLSYSNITIIIIITYLCSYLSFKYIENPVRKKVVITNRKTLFYGVVFALIIVATMGLIINCNDGFIGRLPKVAQQYMHDQNIRPFTKTVSLKDVVAQKYISIGCDSPNAELDYFVIGDSHAMSLLPLLDKLGKTYKKKGEASVASSTIPLLDTDTTNQYSLKNESRLWNEKTYTYITNQGIRCVIIVAMWNAYKDNININNVKKTISKLINGGATVIILKQVPYPDFDVPKALALNSWRGKNKDIYIAKKDVINKNRFQDELFAQIPHSKNLIIIDPSNFFRRIDGNYSVENNGRALYCDSNHLSVSGALFLLPAFEVFFKCPN